MRRARWILTAVLVVGLTAGLTFAWVFAPGQAQGTPPKSLRADYKDLWREAIAASYIATGNLGRAHARLQLLGDLDPVQALSAQAQRALAAGLPFENAQELARLASDLQAGVSSLPSRTPAPIGAAPAIPTVGPASSPRAVVTAPSSGTATVSAGQPTSLPTLSPVPSPTPMPSPSVPFRLVSRDEVCDPNVRAGLLEVTVLDAEGRPLPGMEITITWEQGTDRFFTGLQPEINPGYADYVMQGGVSYSLQVARLGIPVSGLATPICTSAAGQPFLGSVRLTFRAP